jgi:hypothetical protein
VFLHDDVCTVLSYRRVCVEKVGDKPNCQARHTSQKQKSILKLESGLGRASRCCGHLEHTFIDCSPRPLAQGPNFVGWRGLAVGSAVQHSTDDVICAFATQEACSHCTLHRCKTVFNPRGFLCFIPRCGLTFHV